MEEDGFVDVKEAKFAWPTNTWPRGRHYKTLGIGGAESKRWLKRVLDGGVDKGDGLDAGGGECFVSGCQEGLG